MNQSFLSETPVEQNQKPFEEIKAKEPQRIVGEAPEVIPEKARNQSLLLRASLSGLFHVIHWNGEPMAGKM